MSLKLIPVDHCDGPALPHAIDVVGHSLPGFLEQVHRIGQTRIRA